MGRKASYSQDYQKKCFDIWYLNGRPSTTQLQKMVPEDETFHRRPTTVILNRWMTYGTWDIRADELDIRVESKHDTSLVNKKAEMLRKHQADAAKLADKSLSYLLGDKGFDSSNSAVTAYFKSTEEQRKTAGFSDLLERLDKMTNNDVEKEIIALLQRGSENDQIIDAESEDIEKENTDDATSTDTE